MFKPASSSKLKPTHRIIQYSSLRSWKDQTYPTANDFYNSQFSYDYVVDNAQYYRPVEKILTALLAHWPGNVPKIQPIISRAPSFQAITTIENEIWISIETIDQLTEPQLAAVLAHELSHILLGHLAGESSSRARAEGAEALVKYASNIAEVTTEIRGDIDKSYTTAEQRELDQKVVQMQASSGLAANADRQLTGTFHGVHEEYEADILAFDLLKKAGFKTQALTEVLQILRDEYIKNGTLRSQLKQHFETSSKEAIGIIKDADVKATALQNLQLAMTTAADIAKQFWFEKINASHPPYSKRIEALSTYEQNTLTFDDAMTSKPPTVGLNAYKKTLAKRLLAQNNLAIKLAFAQAEGDDKEVERLIKTLPQPHNLYLGELKAKYYFSKGNYNLAVRNLPIDTNYNHIPLRRMKDYSVLGLQLHNSNTLAFATSQAEKYYGLAGKESIMDNCKTTTKLKELKDCRNSAETGEGKALVDGTQKDKDKVKAGTESGFTDKLSDSITQIKAAIVGDQGQKKEKAGKSPSASK